MAAQMSARFGSFVALALGLGLKEAEVALPEPAAGSEAKVGIAAWGKLVAEGGQLFGYRL